MVKRNEECRRYAEERDVVIIDEYIDRAQSATTDKRPEFQRMISDSENGYFDTILVYQFDRFSRNREDSGYYKKILRNNGVKVVSAKEEISPGASGVFTEGMLEIVADYYSKDLAEKIRRGVRQRAEQCKYTGGGMTFGYGVDQDGYYIIDDKIAPIVREIYERTSDGETAVSIMEDLNKRGIKTSKGKPFSKNSLRTILRNERYKGIYLHGDIRIPDGMPRIISDELFDEVQRAISDPPRGHRPPLEDYLLSGKLFCGHCKDSMIGMSGSSKTGKTFRYYRCSSSPRKCDKKNVRKDHIELLVMESIQGLITDEVIEDVIKAVIRINEQDQESSELIRLRHEIKDTEGKIERMLDQIEEGNAPPRAIARVSQREEELKVLQRQLTIEQAKQVYIDPVHVRNFLRSMRDGDIKNMAYKKMLINVFVDKIYLYDDYFRLLLNFNGNKGKASKHEAREIERSLDNLVREQHGELHHIS